MDATIKVKDSQVVPQPISGVLVRVFDDAEQLLTQATTDDDGEVEFSLDEGTYILRLRKEQVGFQNPFSIEVDDADTGSYTINGEVLSTPTAVDPNLCRLWGYFRDASGALVTGVVLEIVPCPEDAQNPATGYGDPQLDTLQYPGIPSVVGGDFIIPKTIQVSSTAGLAWVDLPRGGQFRVRPKGQVYTWVKISVPDVAGANLFDILYPILAGVDPDEVEVAVNETTEIEVTVTLSDGTELESAGDMVDVTSSDEEVLQVSLIGNTLTLSGISVGEADVEMSFKEGYTAVRRPTPDPVLLHVSVTA